MYYLIKENISLKQNISNIALICPLKIDCLMDMLKQNIDFDYLVEELNLITLNNIDFKINVQDMKTLYLDTKQHIFIIQ